MDKLSGLSEYRGLCPKTEYLVNWWQLYPSHSVKLEPTYQREMLSDAISMSLTYTELARRTGLHRKALPALYRLKRNPSIYQLSRLVHFLGREPDELNDKITEIAGIRNPKLPFNLDNPNGSEIIGAFLSDGHLPGIAYKNPMYCALEEELHLRLISACREVFGDFQTEVRQGHKSLLTRFPCPIGTALEMAGVPRGDKRRKNPFLPLHIIDGSEEVKSSYLRRVFDDEGDVCFSSKKAIRLTRSTDAGDIYNSLNLEKRKWLYGIKDTPYNNLILGEYLLLREFGINAKLYREGIYRSLNGRTTVKWRIQVAQQDNLKLFAEKISFNHSIKKDKLAKVIASFQGHKASNGFTESIIWCYVLELSKHKKFITFNDIGQKLNSMGLSHDFAGRFLAKFVKSNKIKKLKRGVYSVERIS